MAKRKDSDEVEILQQENRDLRATIKSLRKKLKRLTHLDREQAEEVEKHIEEDVSPNRATSGIIAIQADKCPFCEGDLAVVSLAGRKFTKCQKYPICKYRTEAVKE